MRILVVEDDPLLGDGIRAGLALAAYAVDWARDGDEALRALSDHDYNACVLDLGLPRRDGLSVLRELRQRGSRLPVIILTARDTSDDKIIGLDSGADDYLTKPFSPRELLARIKAVLRRRSPEDAGDPLRVGTVQLDPVRYRVTIQDQEIILGPTEFKLLQFFLANPDRVFSRDQVLDRVWGDHRFLELRTVDVYIRRLRAALRDRGVDGLIETVRGVGYRCAPEALG